MADAVFFSVVALAKAGIECCRDAQVCKEEAVRIGKRLILLVARAHEWGAVCDRRRLVHFHEVAETACLCLQAIAKSGDKRSTWNRKLKITLQSQTLFDQILETESHLYTAINDLYTEQSKAISSQQVDVSKGVSELLDQFGTLPMRQSDPSVTIQQQFDQALAETHAQARKVAVSTPKESNSDATLSTNDRFAVSRQYKSTFRPSKEDLLAISLQPSLLSFCDDPASLLGGGGFAEVFRGTYDFRPVAIKRLKVYRRDMASLSPIQIAQDVEQLAAEALLTHKCGSHSNIIHVVGCITTLNEVERPLIVMELMHTTLFNALHDKVWRSTMGFSRCLFLLKGIAGALEFLHLQGIVHHDIKSLNILLNKDLTVAKLADFGESKVKGLHTTKLRLGSIMATTSHQGNQIAGTAAYQAPEILSEEVNDTSRSCEMFSFGVAVWECLTRKIPHGGKKESTIVLLAATKKHLPMLVVPPHPFKGISEIELASWKALEIVATSCLSRNRSARPTASVTVALWHNVKCPQDCLFTNVLGSAKSRLPIGTTIQGSTNQGRTVDELDSDCEEMLSAKATVDSKKCCCIIFLGAIVLVTLLAIVAGVVLSSGSSQDPLSTSESESDPQVSIFPTPTRLPTTMMLTGVPASPPSLEHPTLTTKSPMTVTPPPRAFETRQELYNAVNSYIDEFNSKLSSAAITYGYPIGSWDVSQITNFTGVFDNSDRNVDVGLFDEDLSRWDVAAAITMKSMFRSMRAFSGDLSLWNVSRVKDMSSMFEGAEDFNSDLSLWDVGMVTDMSNMFSDASNFNGNLSLWKVGDVADMTGMFSRASDFNGDLSLWNVGQVTSMSGMFYGTKAFNGNISLWNVGQVTDMSFMFTYAVAFNGDVSKWNVSQVKDMSSLFAFAYLFSGNLSAWDVGQVEVMEGMFTGASAFNSDLSLWNVGKATDMSSMFREASIFNSNLSFWNVGQVVDMSSMFGSAFAFNSSLISWNVALVVSMSYMFSNASVFNSNLSLWNVSRVTDMQYMFEGAVSFDSNLCNWLTKLPSSCNVDQIFLLASLCPDTADTILPIGPMCHVCDI